MAFPDPLSLTIAAVATNFNKLAAATDSKPSVFQTADSAYRFSVSHAYGKRIRRVARLDHKRFAPDVLQPATMVPYTMSCYLVVDVPTAGYSIADQKIICTVLTDFTARTSGSDLQKVLEGHT